MLLYDKRYVDLGVRDGIVPPNYSVCDLTAAGLPATGFERELTARRWDVIVPIGSWEAYCSGFGEWEERYFWKLDSIIYAGYGVSAEFPRPMLVRRPGADVDRAMTRAAALLCAVSSGGGCCSGSATVVASGARRHGRCRDLP